MKAAKRSSSARLRSSHCRRRCLNSHPAAAANASSTSQTMVPIRKV